ncbi:TonB-dependent receptor [Ekhidna sp.]|uniref:TonB-dependent receptor n=1 Tax=Ekhidna sp. TaxID=2608089 RepID=UPI003297B5CB
MKFHRLLYLLIFLPVFSWSQDSLVRLDLKQILNDLQGRYEIQFSYVDEVVEGKLVQYDTTYSLNEALKQLELTARLRFERVEHNYFVVRNYRSDDLISLCGRLANFSGDYLLGVSVSYSPTEGVFTDDSGLFTLDSIPFDSWLTFRYVGYSTKRLKVSRLDFKDCIKIRMAESVEELEEIIVSDYLTAGISKNRNTVRIDPHTLKTLAGLAEPDILQSIQQVPGVNSPFETATGIHVRGGLPDQNLVLWNGIKTYNQGHFFGMISAFNPYITNSVKFIKHGTPAEYGDRISSVIDISSNAEVAKSISGGAGTNMLYTDSYINVPIVKDKFSIQLSGRRSFTDLIQTPTYQQISDRVFQNTKIGVASTDAEQNSFYFTDLAYNSIWQINEYNKLILNGIYNRNQLDFKSQNQLLNQSFNDKLLHANEGLNLQWKGIFGPQVTIDASSSYSRYILRYDFIESIPDTITQSSKKNFVQEGMYQLNGGYKLNGNSHLKVGYHLTDTKIRYAYETESPSYAIVLDSDNSKVTTHAGYVKYNYDNDILSIQPGVRFSYYHQLSEAFIEPRLYVMKRLSKFISASFSGEYRTQVSSQIKESVVSDLSLENKVWAIASPDRFPILKSYQFTFGVDYQWNGWYAESEVYLKKLDGVTTLIFGYLNGLANEFREGNSRIHGTDVLFKRTWLNYEAWLSYAYIRTENSFSGINNEESFPGSWSIEHTIRWSNIVKLKDWELSLGWMWHTGKLYTDVSLADDGAGGPVRIFYEAINSNNLPDYHRMDFAAMKEFKSAKKPNVRYRAGISILNLYNRRNLINREFRTTPSLENELVDTQVYSLGITPNLVFRIFW